MDEIELSIDVFKDIVNIKWWGLECKKDKFTFNFIKKETSIDKLLIDFISCNFDNSEESFNFFTQFYGEIENEDIVYPDDATYEEVKELATQYYSKNINKVKEIQADYKMAIDFIYNINSEKKLEGLTYKQRFYIFEYHNYKLAHYCNNYQTNSKLIFGYDDTLEEKGTNKLDYLIKYIKKYDPEGTKLTGGNTFYTNNMWTVYYILLYHLVLNEKLVIKKCKNCGRYFATTKSNSQFCDRIVSDSKTCKEIGNVLSQKKKEKDDPVYKLYRQIFAKKSMLVKRNPDITSYQYEYDEWKEDAQAFRKQVEEGTKTSEEFAEWLAKNN